MSVPVINEIIAHPTEERNIEFKQSTPWQENKFKAEVTKTILGMSNIRDGGWIVIGKRKLSDGTYEPYGMNQSDYDTYDYDKIIDFVREYADPYVTISVQKPVLNQKKFVVIRIHEFDHIPVICKRDWGSTLHRGKIYTRSMVKPETIEVPSHIEMREIIEMAVDKENRKFFARLYNLGLLHLVAAPSQPQDKELFDKQLEGLL